MTAAAISTRGLGLLVSPYDSRFMQPLCTQLPITYNCDYLCSKQAHSLTNNPGLLLALLLPPTPSSDEQGPRPCPAELIIQTIRARQPPPAGLGRCSGHACGVPPRLALWLGLPEYHGDKERECLLSIQSRDREAKGKTERERRQIAAPPPLPASSTR